MIIFKKGSEWNKSNWIVCLAGGPGDEVEEKAIIQRTENGIEIQILDCDDNLKELQERISIDESKSPLQIRISILPQELNSS